MDKRSKNKIATDLMVGLLRKGWILSQHATQMTATLNELIDQNETLRDLGEENDDLKRRVRDIDSF